MTGDPRKRGALYEDAAARYLESIGWRIVERNYRARTGEIDILALDGDILVAVEVKYRKSMGYGAPEEAVTLRKQQRICRALLVYLAQHGISPDTSCRFDVIAIGGDGRMRHIRGAFSAY